MKAKEIGFAVEISVKTLYNNISRAEYGHWEMDLVVSCKGGKGALLIVLENF